MALGQALDLSPARQNFAAADIAKMQALKTGALFRFACEAGAVLGRASPSERAALLAYASAFGQAFQLADDLLDAEGDAAALGKAVAKDEARGKATLVALLGVEGARTMLAGLVAEAEAALEPLRRQGRHPRRGRPLHRRTPRLSRRATRDSIHQWHDGGMFPARDGPG